MPWRISDVQGHAQTHACAKWPFFCSSSELPPEGARTSRYMCNCIDVRSMHTNIYIKSCRCLKHSHFSRNGSARVQKLHAFVVDDMRRGPAAFNTQFMRALRGRYWALVPQCTLWWEGLGCFALLKRLQTLDGHVCLGCGPCLCVLYLNQLPYVLCDCHGLPTIPNNFRANCRHCMHIFLFHLRFPCCYCELPCTAHSQSYCAMLAPRVTQVSAFK